MFNIILIAIAVHIVGWLTLAPLYYAIKWGKPYIKVLKEMYVDCLLKDFLRGVKHSFWPMCKKIAKVLYNGVCTFIEWCKPPKPKHIFTDELDCAFRMVLADYTFAPMIPEIVYHFEPPSHISIGVYAKSIITPEIAQELTWHIQSVFQRYIDSCLLNHFEYTVIPSVIDNKITLNLFYCEYPEEYPLYSMACRQATYMNIERTCPPLPEQLEVKGRGVVLGYKFDNWQSSGQVVPIMWDSKRANHILVSGLTGGGKTIWVKKFLENLLMLDSCIVVCDYKNNGDYRSFGGSYAVGDDCDSMLKKFCDDFEKVRHSGVTDGKRHVLIFDEWGSYTASKSKKEYEELMNMITSVIQQGRSFLYTCILCSQRFDASSSLRGNLKEQFAVKVYLGSSISTESATMLFPNSEIDKSARLQEYCGYISTPTTDLEVIITPKLDIKALDRRIKLLSGKDG